MMMTTTTTTMTSTCLIRFLLLSSILISSSQATTAASTTTTNSIIKMTTTRSKLPSIQQKQQLRQQQHQQRRHWRWWESSSSSSFSSASSSSLTTTTTASVRRRTNQSIISTIPAVASSLSNVSSSFSSSFSNTCRTSSLFTLRGGGSTSTSTATSLPVLVVVALYFTISTIQSLLYLLSPQETILGYGIVPNGILTHLILESGGILANTILFLGLQLFYNTGIKSIIGSGSGSSNILGTTTTTTTRLLLDWETALGYSTIPYILVILHKILTEKYQEIGIPLWNAYFMLLLNVIVAYSCFSSTPITTMDYYTFQILVQIYGLISIVNGILYTLFPTTTATTSIFTIMKTMKSFWKKIMSKSTTTTIKKNNKNSNNIVNRNNNPINIIDDDDDSNAIIYLKRNHGRILLGHGLSICIPLFWMSSTTMMTCIPYILYRTIGWINVIWVITWIIEFVQIRMVVIDEQQQSQSFKKKKNKKNKNDITNTRRRRRKMKIMMKNPPLSVLIWMIIYVIEAFVLLVLVPEE